MKKHIKVLLCTAMVVSAVPVVHGGIYVSAAQAASAQVEAIPAASTVFVNGQEVKFEMYNINGSNYIKLRDLAKAFGGTAKSFALELNAASNAINILPGKAYSPVGGELKVSQKWERQSATVSKSTVLMNGKPVSLNSYNINGSSYFKLSELGKQLSFPVTSRSYDNSIQIITYPNVSITPVSGETYAQTYDYNYGNWIEPSQRYLFKTGERLNLLDVKDQTVYIQQYTSSFYKLGEKTVKMELPLFGGFHMDDKGNYYIIYGQENMGDSDSKIVYRVVKYDASWKKIGQADISDVYVSMPFDASNVTMDSRNGQLIIHSGRQRYLTAKDGLRHQSNISFLIDTNSMTVLQKGGQWPENHVSHTFATYVRFDGDRIVYVDHGDAYPRSIVLQTEENGKISQKIDLVKFVGETGDNYTGAFLGGLEVSASNYLVVGANSVNTYPRGESSQNVFLSVVPKNAQSAADVKKINLTNYAAASGIRIRETHLSRINEDKFVILWEEKNKNTDEQALFYAVVDGQGTIAKKPMKLGGVPAPGNMAPLVQGNTLTWYFSNSYSYYSLIRPNVIEFYKLSID